MNWLLFHTARAFLGLVQALPLEVVARIGRWGGGVAWHLDRRHRRVALGNLERVFGSEKSVAERTAIARENFRRLGENYLCALKTAAMSPEALRERVEWSGFREKLPRDGRSAIGAIGHFGNFELFARIRDEAPGWTAATTYRALRQPGLDRVFQKLREQSGTLFFERRTEGEQLRQAMGRGRVLLALLSDQHAGDRGAWLPFLGQPCSCSTACAVLALRYDAVLGSAICYRVGLARWRLEVGDVIPTRNDDGTTREIEDITRDINSALEAAVRKDPANWFWVHRRWKPPSKWQAAREPDSSSGPGTMQS
ncbi:MAG TPA: hypothetical protein PLX89_26145 [Verrucomicrobiota bacterium]|nr:hypothetical protein [Verrucomicrobiota bacterium]